MEYTQMELFPFVDIGVDWLTVTAKPGEPSLALSRVVDALYLSRYPKGAKVKPWVWRGYTGYCVEGIRFGKGRAGTISIMSGGTAQMYWKVYRNLDINVTRLDIQATVTLPSVDETVGQIAWEEFTSFTSKHEREYRGSQVVSLNGGHTVYIGSRQSIVFLRLYDKGAEKGGNPGFEWRWEAEIKKPLAKEYYLRLCSSTSPKDDIFGYVSALFSSRGVQSVKQFLGLGSKLRKAVVVDVDSDETTLRWIRMQVRPSLQKLLDNGRIDDVERALGYALHPYL